MPTKAPKKGTDTPARRASTRISRGNDPIGDENRSENPPPVKPDPTPEEAEKLISRGQLMAVLYAEVGSYAKVAELFGVTRETVRWWVHRMKQLTAKEREAVAARLRGDIAHLAVDRVQEGLLEGDTEFAADLGRRVLHGLGELRNHTSLKTDGNAPVTNLTLNIVRPPDRPASEPAAEIIEGAVVGKPRELVAAPQSSADE